MKIVVVGGGYVGLVTGTCFAETGHRVTVVEIDRGKLDKLQRAEVPFYEPGLSDLMQRNIEKNRLFFTDSIAQAVPAAECAFIAVGTPQGEDGSADLNYVIAAARDIARSMTGELVVVLKSTVPVGTHKLVEEEIKKITSLPFSVVNNPEFLKEGAALDDFMRPDRVVVGVRDEKARKLMADLYEPFVRTGNPILFMDNASAEISKYAANVMLAARISFMNEVALLCDAMGADVEQVRLAIGSDRRIGPSFLFAGAGFGGSCFPKDIRALIKTGQEKGVEMYIAQAADRANERQKLFLFEKINARFGQLRGRVIGVWGLSFKPRTDDIREAPALVIIEKLLAAGAAIQAYDPEAMENTRRVFGKRIVYCADAYQACRDADALVIITEWNEFRRPDFGQIKAGLKQPIVFDGRNIFDPRRMKELGFEYHPIGRAGALNSFSPT